MPASFTVILLLLLFLPCLSRCENGWTGTGRRPNTYDEMKPMKAEVPLCKYWSLNSLLTLSEWIGSLRALQRQRFCMCVSIWRCMNCLSVGHPETVGGGGLMSLDKVDKFIFYPISHSETDLIMPISWIKSIGSRKISADPFLFGTTRVNCCLLWHIKGLFIPTQFLKEIFSWKSHPHICFISWNYRGIMRSP